MRAGGAPLSSNALTSYSVGTAYSLTNTQAALTFGTTSPSITITSPGTYLIFYRAVVDYTGATFAAVRTATFKLRRTNNTAADVTGSSVATLTSILTLITSTMAPISGVVTYTTTNSDDVVKIFGALDVVPTAGSLDVSSASIVAIRLQA